MEVIQVDKMVEPQRERITIFKVARVSGIGYNQQCSDQQTHAKLVKAQIVAHTSGYCKHVKRCSVSNS